MKDILNVKNTKKKHLSNIHSNKYVLKHLKKVSMKHLEQKLLVTS